MRVSPLFACLLLALAACGNSVPPGNTGARGGPAPAPATTPSIRAIFPADLSARGRPDNVPHPTLQRIVLQAPAGTPIRVLRGSSDTPFRAAVVQLSDGTSLHELELEQPLGTSSVVVSAGDYTLALVPDADAGVIVPPALRPRTPGALADDLARPRGAVFPSTEIGLLLAGGLPSLSQGLSLRCGQGSPVPLQLAMSRDGITAVPATAPQPGRIYHVAPATGARTPYGTPAEPPFWLVCAGPTDRRCVRMLHADINRDGEPELLALYADGAVTALSDPERAAETLVPGGDEAGIDFAVGDFTGNGAQDLAILLRGPGGSRLLRLHNQSRGNGARFVMHGETLEGEFPVALCAADFDRDGRDDLAVLGAFGEVALRCSNRPPAKLPGLAPRMLAAGLNTADFNGDGRPDLLVTGADGASRVLLNQGTTFREQPSLRTDPAQFASTGDLDGDRSADLVFSGRGSGLHVVLGAESRQSRIALRAGDDPRLAGAMLLADVNRDSRSDILVALEDTEGASDAIALYLNHDKADGVPDATLPLGVRLRINRLACWREHLMIASDAGLMMLKVNTEQMPPSADSKVRFVPGYNPVPRIPSPLAAAVADLNDDGRADLAALDKDGRLQVWLAGQEGEPFALSGEAVELGGPGSLQAIDFDKDAFPDLLFIPEDTRLKPRLLRNNRQGRFAEDETGLLPTPPTGLRGAPALGDFDRDGDLDVFWPSPLGRVQFNNGRNGWLDSRSELEIRDDRGMRLQLSGELCCADFTRDGIADIVAVMQPGENMGPQYIVLWAGTGSAEEDGPPFKPTLTLALTGRFFGLSPADYTGNGRLDLALGYAPEDGEPRLTLLQLRDDLTFEAFEGAPAAGGVLLDLAMDDLDRDGDLDLIVTERNEGAVQTTLWVNDGRGVFKKADEAQKSLLEALGGFEAVNLSLADFNGDGRPDLLAIDADGNVVLVRTTLP